jgi:hypothetical protein
VNCRFCRHFLSGFWTTVVTCFGLATLLPCRKRYYGKLRIIRHSFCIIRTTVERFTRPSLLRLFCKIRHHPVPCNESPSPPFVFKCRLILIFPNGASLVASPDLGVMLRPGRPSSHTMLRVITSWGVARLLVTTLVNHWHIFTIIRSFLLLNPRQPQPTKPSAREYFVGNAEPALGACTTAY